MVKPRRQPRRNRRRTTTSSLLQAVSVEVKTIILNLDKDEEVTVNANQLLSHQDRPCRIASVTIQMSGSTNAQQRACISFKLHSSDGEGAIQTAYTLFGSAVRTFHLRMPKNIDFMLPKQGNNVLFTVLVANGGTTVPDGSLLCTFRIVYKGAGPLAPTVVTNVQMANDPNSMDQLQQAFETIELPSTSQ